MSILISFFIMILVGIIATLIFEIILKTNKTLRYKYYKNHAVFFGWHIHHSVYGLICFIISAVLLVYDMQTHSILMFGFGIGIIIMHTISDKKFIFIERQKDK